MQQLTGYEPDEPITFGKYKGCELSFIYNIDPQYIEWAMINVDHFYIYDEDFKGLPTIGNGTIRTLIIENIYEKYPTISQDDFLKLLYKLIQNSLGQAKVSYAFSAQSITENDRKRSMDHKPDPNDNDDEDYDDYYSSVNRRNYTHRIDYIEEAFEGDASALWNID